MDILLFVLLQNYFASIVVLNGYGICVIKIEEYGFLIDIVSIFALGKAFKVT